VRRAERFFLYAIESQITDGLNVSFRTYLPRRREVKKLGRNLQHRFSRDQTVEQRDRQGCDFLSAVLLGVWAQRWALALWGMRFDSMQVGRGRDGSGSSDGESDEGFSINVSG
jgi:hypothetical protein